MQFYSICHYNKNRHKNKVFKGHFYNETKKTKKSNKYNIDGYYYINLADVIEKKRNEF